jgi:hypothetical protein
MQRSSIRATSRFVPPPLFQILRMLFQLPLASASANADFAFDRIAYRAGNGLCDFSSSAVK